MKVVRPIVCILCLSLWGCSSVSVPPTPSTPSERAKLRACADMKESPNTPFTQESATRISGDYFGTFFGSCGSYNFKEESDVAWIYSTRVGYAARIGPNIIVAKSGLCVFSSRAVVHWIDGKWRFDSKKYHSFFGDASIEPEEKKEAKP